MDTEQMILFWLVAIVLFSIIEGTTLGLATIWFAVGALVSLFAALLNFSIPVQIGLFIVVSLVLLAFTRPIVIKHLRVGRHKTNLDVIIDATAIVTKDIEAFKFGQVKVNGQIWTAATEEENTITKDSKVKVIKIEGVKLIVKTLEEE